MIGVRKHNFDADFAESFGRDVAHGSAGANGGEIRGLDVAVRRVNDSAASECTVEAVKDFEIKL